MKVSIITPSFNQGKFIAKTLQSVKQQKALLADNILIEHVVFDGGSTDNTLDILHEYNSEITWTSEPDHGQTHAVNKGLKNTTGAIIGWLNSDDIYYPGAIAKVVSFFDENPDIDVVYGMAKHIDIADKVIDSYPTTPFSVKKLTENCFICQPALFFRRRVLIKTGFLDESLNYCMDYEFWVRMALLGIKFAYLQEVLAGSRLYPENKTLSAKITVHTEINDMLKRHLNYVPKQALINYAYSVVNEELNKNLNPYKFAYRLFKVSLNAAKRWNGGVIKFLKQATWHWFIALLNGRFKMWRKA